MTLPSQGELQQLDAQIALYENATDIADALDSFASHLGQYTGADAGSVLTDDPALKFELDQLQSAATKLAKTLETYHTPLTDGASLAGDIANLANMVDTIATTAREAGSMSGADQARTLGKLISQVKSAAGFLGKVGGLNPVIGAMLIAYGAALESAAVGIEQIQDYVDRRDDAIRAAGGETTKAELEAQRAAEEAAAREEARAEARKAMEREWLDLVLRRQAILDQIHRADTRRAYDVCARQHATALPDIAQRASRHGGIASNAPPNGDTLEQLVGWVGKMEEAIAEGYARVAELQANGRDAEADAERARLEELVDAKYDVAGRLRPVLDCVRQVLDKYSTAAVRSRRKLILAGGGALAGLALIGAVVFLPGGGSPEPAASPAAATVNDESAADPAEPEDPAGAESGDAGGSASGVDDALGDWVGLSGEPVADGAVPDTWDIVRFERDGDTWRVRLAGDATDGLSEMMIASMQLIFRDADGNLLSTVIFQLNDQGGFDVSTNAGPGTAEPDVQDWSFAGDAFEVTMPTPDLPQGSTIEAVVRGTVTDSIEDMAEDPTDPMPVP